MIKMIRSLFGRVPISAGQQGERLAERKLRQGGYRILERNLSVVDDEADLVALDPDRRTVVIVEVKTRRGDAQTQPEIAITPTKQFRLARLASRLQQSRKYRDRPFRFDAVAVVLPGEGEPIIRHLVGAFNSPW